MSDFTSDFWSHYVAGITIIGIVACFLLLWTTARKKVASSSDNTTGHVWDENLAEMNNPLPRWWVWLFVITLVFGIVYLVAYPGLGKFGGKLGWTEQKQYEAEMAKAKAELEPLYARFRAMKIEDLAKDPQAMAIGDRLFMNNCAQCHGSDARGSKGFPNLTDNDWLHGGTPEKIQETITNGRIGIMPPMAAAVGTADDVRNVAHYVLSLSNSPHDSVRAALGKPKFAVCAACHGADGKGNQDIGAPNLTDDIWLHGYGEDAIIAMINNGKTNQMPAQKDKLTEDQIRVLTAYVWGLSHNPKSVGK
ncbi:cytochrome-c oxidase, cbb3-type subunit III [Extensimonas vulgaris]|jgi:cytochrome c oxidase cbb3-type subunit 3|uniref:Cbb3-type cytochrome c oxidase subunit n=1 Tax=Extensimonas vulgaris TaxID=1031594 RepID=A0A369AQC6_9BURK|nr:cytochrome-c oxidase, cbb3-type subunit III [Extensimonas vulgaris]RCX11579.1 cytochrome c oxidase cbb3-type subunit 3 [Extensimonas vulgaris]TWI40474.1 cytochrome c oxidase cbb3-type subunit 3 [Extensimonas vulgaris]TXD16495.1 cytochrome-c oxidase, cbb3-type subunit III [Extensimonas vulgaris]